MGVDAVRVLVFEAMLAYEIINAIKVSGGDGTANATDSTPEQLRLNAEYWSSAAGFLHTAGIKQAMADAISVCRSYGSLLRACCCSAASEKDLAEAARSLAEARRGFAEPIIARDVLGEAVGGYMEDLVARQSLGIFTLRLEGMSGTPRFRLYHEFLVRSREEVAEMAAGADGGWPALVSGRRCGALTNAQGKRCTNEAAKVFVVHERTYTPYRPSPGRERVEVLCVCGTHAKDTSDAFLPHKMGGAVEQVFGTGTPAAPAPPMMPPAGGHEDDYDNGVASKAGKHSLLGLGGGDDGAGALEGSNRPSLDLTKGKGQPGRPQMMGSLGGGGDSMGRDSNDASRMGSGVAGADSYGPSAAAGGFGGRGGGLPPLGGGPRAESPMHPGGAPGPSGYGMGPGPGMGLGLGTADADEDPFRNPRPNPRHDLGPLGGGDALRGGSGSGGGGEDGSPLRGGLPPLDVGGGGRAPLPPLGGRAPLPPLGARGNQIAPL
ncbi:hypothetical protein HYH03_003421 [Edaphochlamys debaryana]|uniref:Uncharacterized protein n=1 Tax=Edaphochlamys debaryana TaxID=47281 RepID=A0A835Y9A7_9CHLO|nr:hypothetical protein HYH03_003421 [Edaphochlamys debaryana]|eukprot:KAG2498677.1 hypothetical protein HYH03_003421 [Edaphochlamys debaryana]